MVGAVEEPALRLAFGRDRPALRPRRLGQQVLHLALALADQHYVLDRARRLQRVERQVRDRRFVRIERVPRIIFGAEQPALLRRPGGEDQGAFRPRAGREEPRDLDHRCDAERIVGGTRPDRAALRVRRADAVGVPMAAVADRLVRIFRPGQPAEDVARR